MKLCVVGSGYVGLVTAACMAEVGHHVVGIDIDTAKVDLLNQGGIPIYEPGLEALVEKNRQQGRLKFTTDYALCADAEAIFIAVGTPPDEDGSADLQYVLAAAKSAAAYMPDGCLVVVKSTVPVGTTDKVAQEVSGQMAKRQVAAYVAFNPEFLREGNAVGDFLKPDRIVVGVEEEHSQALLKRMYAAFNRNRDRMIFMDRRSAELTKYAANCMLATRISFMNDLSRLCEVVDGDIESVRRGIGSDERIGQHFLYAGIGYGGSCFPKDVQALLATGEQYGVDLPVVAAAWQANKIQRQWFIDRLMGVVQAQGVKRAAIWGLAFKPGTDDMREAPSIDVVNALLDAGVEVVACDPAAVKEAQHIWGDKIGYEDAPEAACVAADVLVVLTEWLMFREPDWAVVAKKMAGKHVFDARNLYVQDELKEHGLSCVSIGRGKSCL
ncbi:MAG: UDP-glucose/GDP-mannose dehydrogenase family protein [Mariprofundaceae bacterium]|nr:UDP-glucose/GDP-mannose dehydrogenase family protein [Mariprofundaceae bacterium]